MNINLKITKTKIENKNILNVISEVIKMRNSIRKITAILTASVLGTAAFTGCGSSGSGDKEIKVGVCAGPYQDMFKEAIQPSLEEKGYSVEYVEFSDYVQPNEALADGEVNVNIFQHSTYLNNFCEEHDLELTALTEIPTASMGIFSDTFESLDDIEDGAEVAIPNDDTNLSRSLRVLAQAGILTLDPDIDPSKATVDDISENPKNLTFTEVNAEVLTSVLDSVGIAAIPGNYALSAGLNLSDALYNEELSEGYYNVIAVRTEDVDEDFAKDIESIVHSDAFRDVIDAENSSYTAFQKPEGYND